MNFSLDLRFFYTLFVVVVPLLVAFPLFKKIYQRIRLGKNEELFDDLPRRFSIFIQNYVFQRKMFKDKGPGFVHYLLFVGFVVVTIGSAEHLCEGLLHGFSLHFVFGSLYGPLVLLQDCLSGLVVAAVVYFLFRRLVTHPKRMSKDPRHRRDGLIVLAFTGGHMLADILAFGLFALGKEAHGVEYFRPVSQQVAALLGAAGVSPDSAGSWGWIFWGIHIATVGGFLMYIPQSKHLHLFTAIPNIFFSRFKAKGALSMINFEDESQTQFGVAKLNQFSWKDILDAYTCTTCGRCNEFCPTSNTGKPLQPMKLIYDLRLHANAQGDALVANKDAELSVALVSEQSGITQETVWACTTCRACVEACPVMIEHVDKIIDLRRNLVLMEGNMPAELQVTMRNWETQSNPWGMPADSRDEWARAVGVPIFADNPNAEYLFFVGCAGSFNDRNKKTAVAFAKILKKAGVSFAILGKEELCNGETARRAGNEYLAKTMIDANIAVMRRYNVKKILTICPHCFNTFKNDYPTFGFKVDVVMHHTDFIDQLIREGKLKVERAAGAETIKVSFHDSCYLGRYNEIYDQPRQVLSAFGAELVEMPRSHSKGMCCGAGGARMWMEEKIGARINVERAEEALATKPALIAVACPFCSVMLTDGVNAKGAGDQVKVIDVAEFVAERAGL